MLFLDCAAADRRHALARHPARSYRWHDGDRLATLASIESQNDGSSIACVRTHDPRLDRLRLATRIVAGGLLPRTCISCISAPVCCIMATTPARAAARRCGAEASNDRSAGVAWDWIEVAGRRGRHRRPAGPRDQPETARRARRGAQRLRGRGASERIGACPALADRSPASAAPPRRLKRVTRQHLVTKTASGKPRKASTRPFTPRTPPTTLQIIAATKYCRVTLRVVGAMKEYRLSAWPDLDASHERMAYRRMLSDMSQRHVTLAQLCARSGLPRHEVTRVRRACSVSRGLVDRSARRRAVPMLFAASAGRLAAPRRSAQAWRHTPGLRTRARRAARTRTWRECCTMPRHVRAALRCASSSSRRNCSDRDLADAQSAAELERSRSLRIGLLESGYNIVAVLPADMFLPERLAQIAPDMIIVDAESQARDTLEHVVMATRDARRPIVLFTERRGHQPGAAPRSRPASPPTWWPAWRPNASRPVLDVAHGALPARGGDAPRTGRRAHAALRAQDHRPRQGHPDEPPRR